VEDLPVGPKCCIGAGTGLGECYLTPSGAENGGSYQCYPSEGGHVEYAPRNELEVSMFRFLSEKFCTTHRISVERVVSGKGLANVYEFLAHKYPERIDQVVHKEFVVAGDEQGKVVGINSDKPGSLCEQAMSIMISAYGCEVGSAAIKWIPTGGLFVTGGLTPKNIKYIEGHKTDFMLSYLDKGRVSPLLERIPLFAVMVEDLGVRGVHKAAQLEYEKFVKGGGGGRKEKGSISWILGDSAFKLALTAFASFAVGAMVSKRR
jgi:glucokinase